MHGAVVWVVERDLCLELLLVRVVEECDVLQECVCRSYACIKFIQFSML